MVKIIVIFLLFSNFFSGYSSDDKIDYFTRAMNAKEKDDFKEYSSNLKLAAHENHDEAQELYAQNCYDDSDGEKHTYKEAAFYYWLSAKNENPDSYSYLKSLVSNLTFDEKNIDRELNMIVNRWALYFTAQLLKSPNSIKNDVKKLHKNALKNYIKQKFNEEVDETQNNKLIYYFDACFHALFLLNEKEKFSFSYNKLVFDSKTTFIKPKMKPYSYGAASNSKSETALKSRHRSSSFNKTDIIASTNFKKNKETLSEKTTFSQEVLTEKTEVKDNKPKKEEKVPFLLYEFFIDSLTEQLKQDSHHRATQLSSLNHREYPWILAALRFWEAKLQEKLKIDLNDKTLPLSISVDEFKKRLESFEAINKADIDRAIDIIEKVEPFPSRTGNDSTDKNKKIDKIEKKYWKETKEYFCHKFSVESDLCKGVLTKFFTKIENIKVDLSIKEDLDKLKWPILMVHCKKLSIMNFQEKRKNKYKVIEEAQRWFINLESLDIFYSNTNNRKNFKYPELFVKLLEKIRNNGFRVNLQ